MNTRDPVTNYTVFVEQLIVLQVGVNSQLYKCPRSGVYRHVAPLDQIEVQEGEVVDDFQE